MNRKQREILYKIKFIIFASVLSSLGIFFFALKHTEVSEFEKRRLSPLPSFNLASLLKGTYMDSLDMYVADHFPGRERLVELSFRIKDLRGIQSKELKIYNPAALTGAEGKQKISKNLNDITALESIEDTITTLEENESFIDEKAELSKGVVISRGRALQIFGGNNAMAKAFANVINQYYEKLKDSVTVYCVVVPSASDFYMPKQYSRQLGAEKRNIQKIYSFLHPEVKAVDAYAKIAPHKNEYVYFRTDHHWTGLGAYYAYTAFCESAGLTAMKLDEMTRGVKKGFLGSLYWLTRDKTLKDSIDSVEYYKVPVEYKAIAYNSSNMKKPIKTSVWVEHAKGPNSYGVFLGNDYPLMVVETATKNGKTVAIVKNSFGNPFSTFFIAHYEKVLIVDYRYYNLGLMNLIREHKVTDLVFMTVSFAANTEYHINRIRKIMYGIQKPRQKTSYTLIPDSVKNDNIIKNPEPTKKDSL
ncbi:MAG: DHHW family protein [Cytophagaceae bacterium]|nr:DHHW family protein [Cytophagaceae bacterium]MDW8457200.1 DHHW family protein [Cytophagaceae bacterium]